MIIEDDNSHKSTTEILYSLEVMLQKNNENLTLFTSSILNSITLNYSLSFLHHLISSSLATKHIYFIRHAEAFHNKHKGEIPSESCSDPELTIQGHQQAETLSTTIKEKDLNIDLVCISPLKRTIQTFNHLHTSFNPQTSFIITDLLRGPSKSSSKNVGMPLDQIKEYFFKEQVRVNLAYMTKMNWWNDIDLGNFQSENKAMFHLRIQLFLFWIALRKEQNICIISHSTVFKYVMKCKCLNGQLQDIPSKAIEEICSLFFEENCTWIN